MHKNNLLTNTILEVQKDFDIIFVTKTTIVIYLVYPGFIKQEG